nr:integrase arm-type DNA-binding domain-containing protein [Sphingobium nicotianae]
MTDVQIRNAKPRDKAYKLSDAGGLHLFVSPAGGKLWRFKFRIAGREKLLSLGGWPTVSLAAARKARDRAKAQLIAGDDPAHEKRKEKIARQVSAGNSFRSVAEDCIAVKLEANRKADATVGKARWFLSHLTPALGSRPISEIEPAEVLAVLKALERKGHRETARRTRAFASRVFRHGVANTFCRSDPAALLADALSQPIVKHHAAILDPTELGIFLRSIDEYGGGATVKLAMQLSPHLFLRPGELRQGRWEEVDLADAIWTVPAVRTKLRRPHSVPLSRQARALLAELRLVSGGHDLMFPGLRSHLRPTSENALNAAFRRMGFGADVVTAHGLRATASTLLNESGKWHADAIERALAHGRSDAVRGAYARGQHWAERVEMAQWWSDYLDALRDGVQIVPFPAQDAAVAS